MHARGAFESLDRQVRIALSPLGFTLRRIELDGPFGSCYSEYVGDVTAYRVVWDGKDSWLVAEHCKDATDAVPTWTDIALIRTGPAPPAERWRTSCQQLLEALERHVSAA